MWDFINVDNVPPIILAIMGGIAEFLMADEHSWANILVSMFLAGFTGYLVLLLCIEYNVTQGLTGVVCGVSGMSSRTVLNLFRRFFKHKLTKWLNSDDNE